MPEIARRPASELKPLDPGLGPEVLDWVEQLRVIWAATGLSLNQFTSRYGAIDKGTVSRYLNGQRVPRDRWFLDKLLAIHADNGMPVTLAVREHLIGLHLRALQVAHPHGYQVRLVSDELEIALTGKLEAERYARSLEEQLAERNRQVEELTDDKGRLRAAWDADRLAAQAEYELLTQEIEDITKQLHLARERAVQAEQRCQQLEVKLDQLDVPSTVDEDSVREFITAMANEPDGLIVADEIGRIIVFNRAATRLTGLDSVNVIGKFVFDVLPLCDSDDRDWWAYTDPYHGLSIRTRHPERTLYLADGTALLVSVSYVRDRDLDLGIRGAGSVRRLVISLRDTLRRTQMERRGDELVYTVAHEIRSPLASIKGFTATLLSKWSRFTDDQKRVILETINADADRVTRLVSELLDVSRIESTRLELQRQLVDLPDRARKIIAGRVALGEPEDRFRVEVHSHLPETWLDVDKIDRILGELVENAVRHGAGTVTIAVEPAYLNVDESQVMPDAQLGAPDAVTVCVRDQGRGISPDITALVFRKFSHVNRHGNRRSGYGLGLYIVKGLVDAHGGTIGVRSAPGGGAEFRFIMPAGMVTD